MRLRFFAYLFVIVLACSCKKDGMMDCFKSNGKASTETRYPGSFSAIKVYDKIDVVICQGPECKVVLAAGSHVIKNILTEVKDGELQIKNNNSCNFVRGYKKKTRLTITVPLLSQLRHMGVGEIKFEGNFTQDSLSIMAESSGDIRLNGTFNSLRIASNGNGDIYLAGSCRQLNAYMKGTNYLYARDLAIGHSVFVETLSVGDCYINAASAAILNSHIWRSGNVYYRGNPPSINSVYGSGSKGRLIADN